MISDDIDRAVGSGVRDIVNYSSWIMRTTISFGDGNWQKIVLKHGEAMWLRVRDKFEVQNGLPEHKLQGFVISTMQRLFREWKARLHVIYSSYDNDKDRLSHHPGDVELDDWKHLVKYFGSDEFKVVSKRNKRNREKQITKHSCGTRSSTEVEKSTINPLTGEKETPDKIWEIQYTFKNVNGERRQLQTLVVEQRSEEIENPMTSDEILSSVLGTRSGYVQGK
ncbi:putative transcriptional regulator STERILE APETALA-like [Capsicum annuum]|nr:putative transcriptional regulator STERILE APETALA-like [Capsicum annuum]